MCTLFKLDLKSGQVYMGDTFTFVYFSKHPFCFSLNFKGPKGFEKFHLAYKIFFFC